MINKNSGKGVFSMGSSLVLEKMAKKMELCLYLKTPTNLTTVSCLREDLAVTLKM